jgi:excisionase family DNA binding protein
VLRVSRATISVVDGGRAGLHTVRAVAAFLGVSRATVYALCDRGELPHVRVGNSIRITGETLRAMLDRSLSR